MNNKSAAEKTDISVFSNLAGLMPQFDLIFLGMGADGHTALRFPHTTALRETEKLVAAPFVEKCGTHRLILTPPIINRAANIILQVAGADKAKAVRGVLEGENQPENFRRE